MVFQLEVYYEVDRLLNGLTAQQKATTARWHSNKTSLIMLKTLLFVVVLVTQMVRDVLFENNQAVVPFC